MFEPEAKSVVWGISPVLFIVGCTYHILSIALPHWLASAHVHLGLWDYCQTEKPCVGITDTISDSGTDRSWYRTVQGLEIAATVFVLTALVTGLMRVNLGHNIWQAACGLCAFAAGIFSMAGSVVYGKNYTDFGNVTLSWAYVFNVVSGSMTLASGPIMVVDAIVYAH